LQSGKVCNLTFDFRQGQAHRQTFPQNLDFAERFLQNLDFAESFPHNLDSAESFPQNLDSAEIFPQNLDFAVENFLQNLDFAKTGRCIPPPPLARSRPRLRERHTAHSGPFAGHPAKGPLSDAAPVREQMHPPQGILARAE
jgi:hypothetical protein